MSLFTSTRRRCYACGTRNPTDAVACDACGVTLVALCECGARHSVHDTRCEACGRPKLPRRFPLLRRRTVRLGVAAVVLGAIGTVAVVGLQRPPPSAWQLKHEYTLFVERGDFESAREVAVQLTRDHPADAEGWMQYAWVLREQGEPFAVWVPLLERTLELDPRDAHALLMLSAVHQEQGDTSRAIELLERASRAAAPPPVVFRRLAQLEMQSPDLDRRTVLDHIVAARARGAADPLMDIREAELFLELYAGTPHEFLPIDVTEAVERARQALVRIEVSEGERSPRVALLRARIALALGEAEEALAVATSALRDLERASDAGSAEEDDEARAARFHVVAGQALILRASGAIDRARAQFARALELTADARTANEIVQFLDARGHRPLAESILRDAARAGDPTGALRLRLAGSHLRNREPTRARELLDAVEGITDRRTVLLLMRGEAAAQEGDHESARAAYERAVAESPDTVQPHLSLALLDYSSMEFEDETARSDATVARLDELLSRFRRDPRLLLTKGAVLRVAGRTAEAVELLADLVERHPSHTEAWMELGRAQRALGTVESVREAAKSFEQARRLAPADESVATAEVSTHLLAGDTGAAIVAATDALRALPESSELRRLRARAHRANGRPAQAADDLRDLLARSPRDPLATVALVEAEYKTGRPSVAREVAARAFDWLPEDARRQVELLRSLHDDGVDASLERLRAQGAGRLLLNLELHLGRMPAARETARALLAVDPTRPGTVFSLVSALFDGGPPPEGATAEARAAIDALPDDVDPLWIDLLEGRMLLAAGDPEAALPRLATAADGLSLAAVSAAYHAEALWQVGRRTEALAEYRRAMTLPVPPRGIAKSIAARLRQTAADSDDPRTVASLAAEAVDHDPEDWRAMELLARATLALGDAPGAVSWIDRALLLDLADDDGRARMLLFRIRSLVHADRAADAVEAFERLPAAVADSPVALCAKGFSELALDREDAASETFERAREVAPDDPLPRLGLARVAIARGDAAEAIDISEAWRATCAPADDLGLALSVALERAGELEPALSETRRFIETQREADTLTDDLARSLSTREIQLLTHLGRTTEAIELQASLEGGSDEERRLRLAGLLALDPAKVREALEILDRLPEEWRLRPAAVAARAMCALHLRQAASAEQLALSVLEGGGEGEPRLSTSTRAACHFVLGSTSAARGDWKDAALHFGLQVEFAPGDVDALNNAAWALSLAGGDSERARELARRATRRAPEDPNVWDTLGAVERRAGDATRAIEAWRRAIELHESAGTDDTESWARTALRLGHLLWSEGRPEEGAALRRAALDLDLEAVREFDRRLGGSR